MLDFSNEVTGTLGHLRLFEAVEPFNIEGFSVQCAVGTSAIAIFSGAVLADLDWSRANLSQSFFKVISNDLPTTIRTDKFCFCISKADVA